MEVNLNDQREENDDPWAFLEKELQEFEKVMRALEEGKFSQKCLSDYTAGDIQYGSICIVCSDFWVF